VPHDRIFCGKQAVDGDDSQFPQRLAALLDMACVTEVAKLSNSTARRSPASATSKAHAKSSSASPGRDLDQQGPQRAAPREPQGHHGREEEAARDGRRRARRLGDAQTASFELPPERPPGKVVESSTS
jgi:hypothetical protein